MQRSLLASSLTLLLISAWAERPFLLSFSLITVVVILVWRQLPSKILGGVFAAWMVGVLWLLLIHDEYAADRVFWNFELIGIPILDLILLIGIWLIPILIWPFGFYRHFKRWSSQ